ncbi:MAG: nucleoside triphosphate pyrophosphohydrolase [Alphaproteobacteria bacterium]
MPTFRIEQLVRDKRVPLFEADGCKVAHTMLSGPEFDDALRAKLMEEATEAALTDDVDELVKECADLMDVMAALVKLQGKTVEDVLRVAEERKAKLGGFEGRTYIETLTAPEGSETCAYHKANSDKYEEVK